MISQASFMYASPVKPGSENDLRSLLAELNRVPGVVDPLNSLIPFARFRNLHFARVLVVTDLGATDGATYGLPVAGLPNYLVLMGEVDGDEEKFRKELLNAAQSGLRLLFSHCAGFDVQGDLATWLASSRISSAADYVNWVGRTVLQVREEEELRRALEAFVSENMARLRGMQPQELHTTARQFVQEQQRIGRLTLTAPGSTPWGWRVRNLLDLIGVPLILLVLSPLLLLCLPVFLLQLRRWERSDPEVAPPLDATHAAELQGLENYESTNQFSVFGSLKPGGLRLWSLRFFLWITGYTARHIYNHGRLGRVSTIHFARWVPFDGGQRMLFSSIYDGSLESYMDDFINKVGFGLNITFSNGIGYPRTRWLLFDGCKDEQVFKRVLRRHQLPTEVWYNAHPGLTAANKHRNSLIRAGIDKAAMTDREVKQWISLL
jgi:hypothetical protein